MALRGSLLAILVVAVAAKSGGDSANPIGKVVTLITEMNGQCVKDGEQDAKAYDKYKCWCTTTEEEKTAAIEAAKQKLTELSGFLEEASATKGELKTSIAGLEEDIAKDTEALESATSLRAKENNEFLTEEADAKETLGLLSEAISTLSKVQLVQKHGGKGSSQAALVQVRKLVQRISPKFHNVMQKDLYDMLGSLEGVEQDQLAAKFLPKRSAAALEQAWKKSLPWIERSRSEEDLGKDANPNDLKGAAANAKSYNARSGNILGLLKGMGDETAKSLASAQKEELQALIGFQQLQAAKRGEITAGSEQKNQKETALADLLDKAAKANEDVESTSDVLAADEAFLASTHESCTTEDEEYAKRVKVRNQEIEALGETLTILTGDEARSLFDKTTLLQEKSTHLKRHSFMQINTVSDSAAHTAMQENAKKQAIQRILAAAKKSKNWALASLAVHVRLDAFTKVKVAMDKMLVQLQAQQKTEYAKNEDCKKEIDTTEDKIKDHSNTKDDLDLKHTDLTNTLEVLASDTGSLKDEVAEMEVNLKQAGEQRKSENVVYQQSISDQRATITILNMAADRLKKFYTPSAGLVQVHLHSQAAPPKSSSNAYEKSSNSGGVMQLLSTIISDAQSVEAELKISEQHGQKNYAEFVSETTTSIEANRKDIAQKEEQAAEAKGEKSETQESQLSNDAALTKLNDLLMATHGDCDYVLKYFDLRQSTRAEEMDAIKEAKAILSGANFA